MTNSGLNTVLSEQERQWVDHSGDVRTGTWLVRYARALNSLSVAPLADGLAADVSYESQSVFDRIVGRGRLIGYWQEKFEAIRRGGQGLAAELARWPDGQPCVALYQAASDFDTNWLDTALAVMTIRTNEQGEASSFLMITCVPAPGSARGSGLFPGRAAAPTARPKRFVRASPDFDEITLDVFYLDGAIEPLGRRWARCHRASHPGPSDPQGGRRRTSAGAADSRTGCLPHGRTGPPGCGP